MPDNKLQIISHLLMASISDLYSNDGYFLSCEDEIREGMERSCAFRIGHYFCNRVAEVPLLKDYNIDMEYNKNRNQPKKLPGQGKGKNPDLIVHKRCNNENNLLIVEFKYQPRIRNYAKDIKKLKGFTDNNYEYKYGLGILVILRQEFNSVGYKFYQNGQELSDEESEQFRLPHDFSE